MAIGTAIARRLATRQQASLKRRIRQFYDLLGQHEFARCHRMVDPRVRLKPRSVTLFQYQNSLHEFLARVGSIDVTAIWVDLHLNEPSVLYEGRDFAAGETRWKDAAGAEHVFKERWVREGRSWFTRTTGLVLPDSEAEASRRAQHP